MNHFCKELLDKMWVNEWKNNLQAELEISTLHQHIGKEQQKTRSTRR